MIWNKPPWGHVPCQSSVVQPFWPRLYFYYAIFATETWQVSFLMYKVTQLFPFLQEKDHLYSIFWKSNWLQDDSFPLERVIVLGAFGWHPLLFFWGGNWKKTLGLATGMDADGKKRWPKKLLPLKCCWRFFSWVMIWIPFVYSNPHP